jgi:hypothetical protein
VWYCVFYNNLRAALIFIIFNQPHKIKKIYNIFELLTHYILQSCLPGLRTYVTKKITTHISKIIVKSILKALIQIVLLKHNTVFVRINYHNINSEFLSKKKTFKNFWMKHAISFVLCSMNVNYAAGCWCFNFHWAHLFRRKKTQITEGNIQSIHIWAYSIIPWVVGFLFFIVMMIVVEKVWGLIPQQKKLHHKHRVLLG